MPATLTFHPRRAVLEATAGGLTIHVPIHHDHTRVTAWEHVFERGPGRHTLWDFAFEVPVGGAASNTTAIYRVAPEPGTLEIDDYPGRYAQRFDGGDKGGSDAPHSHPGPAVYVGTRTNGIYIHGWPPCNRATCIIVLQQWDRLRLAIGRETSLSFGVFV